MSVEAGLNPDFLDLLEAFSKANVALLQNKRAAARPKDLLDVELLERQGR